MSAEVETIAVESQDDTEIVEQAVEAGGEKECVICGHALSKAESVIRGMGPVCAARVARIMQSGQWVAETGLDDTAQAANPYLMTGPDLVKLFGPVIDGLSPETFGKIVESARKREGERPGPASVGLPAETTREQMAKPPLSEQWITQPELFALGAAQMKHPSTVMDAAGGHGGRREPRNASWVNFFIGNTRYISRAAIADLPNLRTSKTVTLPQDVGTGEGRATSPVAQAERALAKAEQGLAVLIAEHFKLTQRIGANAEEQGAARTAIETAQATLEAARSAEAEAAKVRETQRAEQEAARAKAAADRAAEKARKDAEKAAKAEKDAQALANAAAVEAASEELKAEKAAGEDGAAPAPAAPTRPGLKRRRGTVLASELNANGEQPADAAEAALK